MEDPALKKEKQCKETHVIEEGQAKIVLERQNIFYNPVQEFNRDLSIAVLSQYSKEHKKKITEKINQKEQVVEEGLRILEALSATGLRSIRYAKEIPGVGEVVANDIAIKAVETIQKNVIHNDVQHIVKPNHDDATMVMYQNRKSKFDVVDLDPYGCPSVFLDGAVQCLKNDGILLVTATDMAVLAGNSPETCYVKYGSVSLKSKACHEIALRILLQTIANYAGRYGRVITPILSISVDFYVRVFVKIHTSQSACKRNTSNLGLLYQCTGCESFSIQPLGTMNINNVHKLPQVPVIDKLCSFCKHKHHMGGPIWIGTLHDKDFVGNILSEIYNKKDSHLKNLKTIKRIQGILHLVQEEIETPLYYEVSRLMSIIKCLVPPMVQFRSALLNAGYKVSYSHACKLSVKTNAPNQVIWDIVRAWEKLNPVKKEKFEQNSAGLAILNSELMTSISFIKHLDAVPYSLQNRMTRFQINPSNFWGPGTKSKIMIHNDQVISKKEKNQNKKRKKLEEIRENSNAEKRKNILENRA